MRFWFDTEFIDDGERIRLISIGIVAEDSREFYTELMSPEAVRRAVGPDHWLIANVCPHLRGGYCYSRGAVAEQIAQFVGKSPEWWAYCGAYDWVALSQLYGTLMDRPDTWPFNHFDTNQLHDFRKYAKLAERGNQHCAIDDARALRIAWALWRVDHSTFPLPEPPETPK